MLPTTEKLIKMFNSINEDSPSSYVCLTDVDYYAEQIENIYEVSENSAKLAAQDMADHINHYDLDLYEHHTALAIFNKIPANLAKYTGVSVDIIKYELTGENRYHFDNITDHYESDIPAHEAAEMIVEEYLPLLHDQGGAM